MGNGFSAAGLCCTRPPRGAATHHSVIEPWPSDDDDTLGHSFRYVRPSSSSAAASPPRRRRHHHHHHHPPGPTFRSISGAAVSANSSSRPVVRSRDHHDPSAASPAPSNPAGFQGSSSFAAAPLQLSSSSGPLDRGFFLSGPIEARELSGPLDGPCAAAGVPFSAPLVGKNKRSKRRGGFPGSDSAVLRRAASVFLRRSSSEREPPWVLPPARGRPRPCVEWAHGKAGEDRVHVVVSEEHRWLFVGIYDGFNGPDAPEFLAAHLYRSVFHQLRGLFWDDKQEPTTGEAAPVEEEEPRTKRRLWEFLAGDGEDDGSSSSRAALDPVADRFVFSWSKLRNGFGGSWRKETHQAQYPPWRYGGGQGKERATGEATCQCRRRWWKPGPVVDHGLVLGALSRALEVTELAYLEMTDREIGRNPELALMGSCLLVALMREDDLYVMNVGDSRAIIAQYRPPAGAAGGLEEGDNCSDGLVLKEDIVGAVGRAVEEAEGQEKNPAMELVALQLSTDHSTSIEDEVRRIKEEHPDDSKCIINNRVKGRLKVTRAFGAGFLKQPKWNNGLLEMFRNEYIGVAPYISCSPSLCHHKLSQNDQFLVVSSDGLYQYLSNEEVVSHVQNFLETFPDGDPAQSLIEELLFRAASKAGMDFFELLDIPQGDRRKYHDDVAVLVISLEGRIWDSSSKD